MSNQSVHLYDCAISSRNHIQNFTITAAPLFKLTRQDSGYLSGPLPTAAKQAFQELQTQLCQEPTLAFPRSNQEYLLITNAFTPTTELPGGLCATLAQKNEKNQIKVISHGSRQLKENEKNYTQFLLETAAAVWGMDNFNKYFKRITIHSLHGSDSGSGSRHHTNEDVEQIKNGDERT